MNTGNICYDYLYDLVEIKYITKERAIKFANKIKVQTHNPLLSVQNF